MKERRYTADYGEDEWRLVCFRYSLSVPLIAVRSSAALMKETEATEASWSAKRIGNRIVVERGAVVDGARYVSAVTIAIPPDLADSTFDAFLSDTEPTEPSLLWVYNERLELRSDHPSRRAWWQAVIDMCEAGRDGDAPAWYAAWARLLDLCGVGAERSRDVSDALVSLVGSDVAGLIADEERLLSGCPEPVRRACGYAVSYMLTSEMRPCLDHVLGVGGLTASGVRDMVKYGGLARSTPCDRATWVPQHSFPKCYLPRPLVDLMALADGEVMQPYHLDHQYLSFK